MSKFQNNITIRDAASGFYLDADFIGLRYLVGNTTGNSIELYQEEEPQNSLKFNLSTITLEDIDGVNVTPASIEGRAALLSVYVSKHYTNTELFTSGAKVGDTNPLPTADVDQNFRDGLNTVFGDRIVGVRKASIGAQFQYGIEDGTSEPEIVSTGTISIIESMLVMSTGVAVDGRARVQSSETIRYVPGQETYCNFTLVFSPPVVGSKQFGGLYDDENGFFVGYDTDAKFYFFKRRDSVDERHEIDLVAFSKRAGYNFNTSFGNVYRITFGYLGFAPISLEVMRPNGGWLLLHKIEYPNSSIITHITQTFLPVRGEVENVGNNTDIVIKSGSLSAGITNGGAKDVAGREFTWSNDTSIIISAETTVIVFRNKDTFQGKINRVAATLLLISAAVDLNKSSRWVVYKNPVLLAAPVPVWTDVDTDNSTHDYSLNAVVDTVLSTEVFLVWNMERIGSFFQLLGELDLMLPPGGVAGFVIEGTGIGDAELSMRWSELF